MYNRHNMHVFLLQCTIYMYTICMYEALSRQVFNINFVVDLYQTMKCFTCNDDDHYHIY